MIELTGSNPEWVEGSLSLATIDLININAHSGMEMYNEYIGWANAQVRMLRGQISSADLDRLVLTRAYWSLRDMNPTALGNNLTETVRRELEAQKITIDAAINELRIERQRWHGRGMEPIALVLDTGVIEFYADALHETDWHELADLRPHRFAYIVVPRVVIDELDRHKQSRDQNAKVRRANARAAIKALWPMFGSKETSTNYSLSCNGRELRGQFEMLTDDIEHLQLEDPDSEILARSRTLAPFIPVKVMTFDTGMALRGIASGDDVLLLEQPDQEPA
jgi:PIN domain